MLNYAERYVSVLHTPKNFGNLLPQVNFQIPLKVDLGTVTPIRPRFKIDKMK